MAFDAPKEQGKRWHCPSFHLLLFWPEWALTGRHKSESCKWLHFTHATPLNQRPAATGTILSPSRHETHKSEWKMNVLFAVFPWVVHFFFGFICLFHSSSVLLFGSLFLLFWKTALWPYTTIKFIIIMIMKLQVKSYKHKTARCRKWKSNKIGIFKTGSLLMTTFSHN